MYSLEDYMSGKALPSRPEEQLECIYYYGVARNNRGRVYPFVIKDDKSKIPTGAIELHELIVVGKYDPGNSPHDKARALLSNYEEYGSVFIPKSDPPYLRHIRVGAITYHADGAGAHLALVLSMTDTTVDSLFFTSNPHWNKFAREMTKDEIALAGFVTRKRKTYFAPVVRTRAHFNYYEPAYSFSNSRVADLRIEFAKGFAIED